MTKDKGSRTKDQGPRTKDKGQRTKDKGQIYFWNAKKVIYYSETEMPETDVGFFFSTEFPSLELHSQRVDRFNHPDSF